MAIQEVIIQTRQALQSANYQIVEEYPPVERFQLADDISITQLPQEVAEQVMDCLEARLFGMPKPVRLSPQLYTFVRTNNADDSIYDWKPDQKLVQCVALSRLVHPTSIPLSLHAKIKLDSDGKLLELIPIEIEPRGAWIADRGGRDWLTEEDAKNLKDLISYLPLSVPTRVSRALWYFEMAARNYFGNVRWTLISTGLEALIHTEKGRSTHQFKTRTAKLAAHIGMTDFTVDTALSFYDLRSQLSHGQGLGALSPKEHELYRLAEDVLRGILLRSIKDKALALTFADNAAIVSNWTSCDPGTSANLPGF
jgi:hypothetical protein